MNKEQLNTAMQAEVVRMTATSFRSEGVKKQYDAACLMGDNALSDTLRFELHALMDITLDSVAIQMSLARKLIHANDWRGESDSQ